jgi:hypothetical protein
MHYFCFPTVSFKDSPRLLCLASIPFVSLFDFNGFILLQTLLLFQLLNSYLIILVALNNIHKLVFFIFCVQTFYNHVSALYICYFNLKQDSSSSFPLLDLLPIYLFPNFLYFLLGWCIFHTGISLPEKDGGFLVVCSKHLILILLVLSFPVSRQLHLCCTF